MREARNGDIVSEMISLRHLASSATAPMGAVPTPARPDGAAFQNALHKVGATPPSSAGSRISPLADPAGTSTSHVSNTVSSKASKHEGVGRFGSTHGIATKSST